METIWGIHNNQDDIDPGADGSVRIGWDELGDLSVIPATRTAFKTALSEAYPDTGTGTIPVWAGTIYRFVHKIQIGDIVVNPDRKTRTLRIGEVTGPYQYLPDAPLHRHSRPVTWIAEGVPREELSISAQNEISSLTTLFEITTGKEEIQEIIDSTAPEEEGDFSWIPFYEELADTVLTYRNSRPELIDKVFTAAQLSGSAHLFKYLQSEHTATEAYRKITDIDPFTVFTPFNRGITSKARLSIAQAYKEVFSLSSKAPTGLAGIPIVNNQNSWFINWEKNRKPREVDNLWDLAEAAIAYAESPGEDRQESLVSAFDACATGQTRKLTMGIFWIRPHAFAAYDSTNIAFFAKHLPELADTLTLKAKLTGEEFLVNTQNISAWVRQNNRERGFPELSYQAFLGDSLEKSSAAPQVDNDDIIPVEVDDSYDVDSIVDAGSFLSSDALDDILTILDRKKNLILQGPPGTGKTWLARRLGWALNGRKSEGHLAVLQFHPSLSYEDFIRGWRPGSDGKLTLADGPFLQFCEKAAEDPDRKFVLVLEEINRGNPAQIFGEMLTLLENSKRSSDSALRLSYPRTPGETFFIPQNVYIIGTMNVADRSLAMVDMALRRRFAFIELEPELDDLWVEYVSGRGYSRAVLDDFRPLISKVNDTIRNDDTLGRHYCIGHSFFVPLSSLETEDTDRDTKSWLQQVIDTEISPLLHEYWFDQPDKAVGEVQTLKGIL